MRLLATWELGTGYGHIANLAPLCRNLRARGHHVSLAARSPVSAATLAADAFDAVVQSPICTRWQRHAETLTYGQVIAAAGFADLAGLKALVLRWLGIFDAIQPDALLVEHAPASLLAAHIAGIPAVRLGQSFVAPRPGDAGTTLLPWATHRPDQLANAARPADTAVREMSKAFGAAPLDTLGALLATAPAHILGWEELDHYGPGATGAYYGPLHGIAGRSRPDWPGCSGPPILVYLPYDGERGAGLVEALARLGWPVLWHSGRAPGADLPANIRFSADPLDLWTMAPRAALFVGRGGAGASAVALRGGVPQLLFPDTLESLLLTYRLRQAGIAHSQRGAAGTESIAESLRQIVGDQRVIDRARQTADRYGNYCAEAAANQLSEDVLGVFGA